MTMLAGEDFTAGIRAARASRPPFARVRVVDTVAPQGPRAGHAAALPPARLARALFAACLVHLLAGLAVTLWGQQRATDHDIADAAEGRVTLVFTPAGPIAAPSPPAPMPPGPESVDAHSRESASAIAEQVPPAPAPLVAPEVAPEPQPTGSNLAPAPPSPVVAEPAAPARSVPVATPPDADAQPAPPARTVPVATLPDALEPPAPPPVAAEPAAPAAPAPPAVTTPPAVTARKPAAAPPPARDKPRADTPPARAAAAGAPRSAAVRPPARSTPSGSATGANPAPVATAALPVGGVVPPPPYPPTALRRREQGSVTIRAAIAADGTPHSVSVARSSGFEALDDAAVAAVRRARFSPATIDGRPVEGVAEVPVRFRLD